MSPSPLLPSGLRTAIQTLLGTAQKDCHFLASHTTPVIAPDPQTRNNYLQNHAWVFKHVPSSCGHGICQILLSPKSFHQPKVHLFFVEAFTLASFWNWTNTCGNTIPTVKWLKCQPCGYAEVVTRLSCTFTTQWGSNVSYAGTVEQQMKPVLTMP